MQNKKLKKVWIILGGANAIQQQSTLTFSKTCRGPILELGNGDVSNYQ